MKTGRPKKEITAPEELEKMFYTVNETADILQVHPNTIRKLIRNGRIQSERVGRLVRIKKSTLENL